MEELLFSCVCVLCVSSSLQQQVSVKEVEPNPRIFSGHPITETPPINGTPASSPRLNLHWDGTAGYLSGALSTLVIPVIYLLVVTVGIPANIAILSLLVTKIRKVSSSILYCSLAVSDLLLLLSLLFKAHYHLHGNHWVLGETACRVVTACFYGNLYCSALTLGCISIKRYLAAVHPFMYKGLPKRTCTVCASLAVWGVFGTAVLPELLVRQTYWVPELNITTCHDVLPADQDSHRFLLYYTLVLNVLCLLAPLLVSAVCFTKVIRELSASHYDWAMYIKSSSLVFAIFLLCFLPAGVLHFLHYVHLFVGGTEGLYVYFNVAVCLCCLHACLDPFLYLCMSRSTGRRLRVLTFKGKTLSLSV
ncbi:proteinase-activated receptor 3 [Parambassis ranga]|uniref:Proteinase-activated receptor 3 n=1 Tax=Parambassis ranga TaxID=210632 RepID=A0A6P7J9J8_9TELE|nr:proteinase-activated receptor 3-like [Parambassis ranga]